MRAARRLELMTAASAHDCLSTARDAVGEIEGPVSRRTAHELRLAKPRTTTGCW